VRLIQLAVCLKCTCQFQVLEIIKLKPKLRKISFVAHSIGGLVSRYAIGVLYQPPCDGSIMDSSESNAFKNSRGTIGGLEAVNFITVATPHLGSRGNKQVIKGGFRQFPNQC